jgi:hypothetical protein
MATLDERFNRPARRSQDMLVVLGGIFIDTQSPERGNARYPATESINTRYLFLYHLLYRRKLHCDFLNEQYGNEP